MSRSNVTSPDPRITFGVSISGAVLLDLSNRMLWPNLGLVGDHSDIFMLSAEWKDLNQRGVQAPTQQLGAAVRAEGYDGIIYPAILSQYIGDMLPRLFNVALFMSPAAPAKPASANVQLTLHDHGLLR